MVPARPALALGITMLVVAACGDGASRSAGSSPTTTGAPAVTGTSAPAPPPSGTDVPDVVLRDVGTGADVNLRALGLPDRPTLYWFWAPH